MQRVPKEDEAWKARNPVEMKRTKNWAEKKIQANPVTVANKTTKVLHILPLAVARYIDLVNIAA